jgi:uncharacterized protein YodC (DUF2158 family)
MGFKVGDVVELNSGGPIMTVQSIHGSQVTCVWFNKTTGCFVESPLFAATLRTAEAPGDPLLNPANRSTDPLRASGNA